MLNTLHLLIKYSQHCSFFARFETCIVYTHETLPAVFFSPVFALLHFLNFGISIASSAGWWEQKKQGPNHIKHGSSGPSGGHRAHLMSALVAGPCDLHNPQRNMISICPNLQNTSICIHCTNNLNSLITLIVHVHKTDRLRKKTWDLYKNNRLQELLTAPIKMFVTAENGEHGAGILCTVIYPCYLFFQPRRTSLINF